MIALYIIGGLLALILIVAAVVGTKWTLNRSIKINAPVDKVWEFTSTLHGMNKWSPWLDLDPAMKQSYTGEDGKPGATYAWESDNKNVGAGNQSITKVTPKQQFDMRINFIKPFKGVADGWVKLQPDGNATIVTWGIDSSTPYPMNIIKVFGIIEKNLNKSFDSGLNKLKSLSEKV